jgi:hypothetical protein
MASNRDRRGDRRNFHETLLFSKEVKELLHFLRSLDDPLDAEMKKPCHLSLFFMICCECSFDQTSVCFVRRTRCSRFITFSDMSEIAGDSVSH